MTMTPNTTTTATAAATAALNSVSDAFDSVKRLLHAEAGVFPGDVVAQRRSPRLRPYMRTDVVTWIQEVCEEFDLSTLTLCTSVTNFDRFMALVKVPRRTLQLVAAVSIFVASKLHDVQPIRLPDLCLTAENAYSPAHIKAGERHFLVTLGWRARVVSPYCFVVSFFNACPPPSGLVKEVQEQAEFFVDFCFGRNEFMRFTSSVLAGAACLLALDIVRRESSTFAQMLLEVANLDTAQLLRCRTMMMTAVGAESQWNVSDSSSSSSSSSTSRTQRLASLWTYEAADRKRRRHTMATPLEDLAQTI